MTNSAKVWDRFAKGYAKKPISNLAAYHKKLEITRGYLRPDTTIVEFGCGTGSTAFEHAPYVRSILATDVSRKMLEIAREKARTASLENVEFQQTALEDLQVADESVDVVLALSLLHLLEDRDAAIAKIFRMLKPGGVFVSNTVCIGDSLPALRMLAPLGRWPGVLPLLKFFTREDLRAALVAAGFTIEHDWQPDGGRAVFIVARKAA